MSNNDGECYFEDILCLRVVQNKITTANGVKGDCCMV